MANGRGGKRVGAGRKPGSKNKATGKLNKTLTEFAAQFTEQAINTLADIMLDTDASATARVSAANSILDRAHGKPVPVLPEGDDDAPQLTISIKSAPPVGDLRVTRSDG